MPIVEGMASGLPVVAAGAGGPLEYVEDGVNGYLYRPGNADELASLLRRLAQTRCFARASDAPRVRASAVSPPT